MTASPTECTLTLTPQTRVELLHTARAMTGDQAESLQGYAHAAFCSHHTTAGFFDEAFCDVLGRNPALLRGFVARVHHLFPAGADYHHDQMDRRVELSAAQRLCEPRNADSHLTFIGAGLANCVTCTDPLRRPVYLMELDGVNGTTRRRRTVTVVGYQRARTVERFRLRLPTAGVPVDTLDLHAPDLGLPDLLHARLRRAGIGHGRVDLSLLPSDPHAGLTVNEYEPLLMRHDLAAVLRQPLRYASSPAHNRVPSRAALRDLWHRFLARVAAHFLRLRRTASLLVTPRAGLPHLVRGTYQSPILMQWRTPRLRPRELAVSLIAFD